MRTGTGWYLPLTTPGIDSFIALLGRTAGNAPPLQQFYNALRRIIKREDDRLPDPVE